MVRVVIKDYPIELGVVKAVSMISRSQESHLRLLNLPSFTNPVHLLYLIFDCVISYDSFMIIS